MKKFKDFILIQEEGEGGGAEGGGGAQGSGDVSAGTQGPSDGGVAYVNQGTIDGMGEITNPTVSPIPGDPDGSVSGSGDVSFVLPVGAYTKNAGITGNKKFKLGSVVTKLKDFDGKSKKEKEMGNAVKDAKVLPFAKFKSIKLDV